MNLAGIIQGALRAVPTGVRGLCTITQSVEGVYDPLTDTETGETTRTATNVSCVVEQPAAPTGIPTGATRDQVRDVTVAPADLGTVIPTVGRTTVTLAEGVGSLVSVATVAPDGGVPILYTLRVILPR